MSFQEIADSAVHAAVASPRKVNQALVGGEFDLGSAEEVDEDDTETMCEILNHPHRPFHRMPADATLLV